LFKKLKEFFGEPSEEERLGQICALVLAQDEFAELRKSKTIVQTIMDRVGDSVVAILEPQETEERIYIARVELLRATKRMASSKRFPHLAERERSELARKYWPNNVLTTQEALSAANTNYCVSFGETQCLQIVLRQINRSGEDNWWVDYFILCMVDPETSLVESAEEAVLNGEGLKNFSTHVEKAQAKVKELVANVEKNEG